VRKGTLVRYIIEDEDRTCLACKDIVKDALEAESDGDDSEGKKSRKRDAELSNEQIKRIVYLKVRRLAISSRRDQQLQRSINGNECAGDRPC
jgi:hypothetical protein